MRPPGCRAGDNPDAKEGRTTTYLVVDEPAALIWVANYGALEWHAWTSLAADPGSPTYALIDIDPGAATTWEDILVLARLHRTALGHLGVRASRRSPGGAGSRSGFRCRRGSLIRTPAVGGAPVQGDRRGRARASQLEVGCQRTARPGPARLHPEREQQDPGRSLQPAGRGGRAVSAPIEWEELDDPALRPDGFTIRTVLKRVAEKGDLFRPVLGAGQELPPLVM